MSTNAKSTEIMASSIYERLLKDILNGDLEPGLKLRLEELKSQYEVGNSPLREALNRLSENGMVLRKENRGFRVSLTSEEELLEVIQTRCWLEEIALRESITNGDDEWEENLVLAFHRLTRFASVSRDDPAFKSEDWERRHREYHYALLSACGSSILLGYCTQLHLKTLRYRNLATGIRYRERQELEEHRAMQEAAINRNPELAIKLMKTHFEIAGESILSSGVFS